MKITARLLTLLLLVLTVVTHAESYTEDHSEAARRLSELTSQAHFLRRPIDAEISERIHKLFLGRMDPEGLFFTPADKETLKLKAGQHGEMISEGNLNFPFEVKELLLQRKAEAAQFFERYFQNPEITPPSPGMTRFLDTEYKARIKNGSNPEEVQTHIRQWIQKGRDAVERTSVDKLVEIYLDSAMKAYDPHSSYMTPSTFKDFLVHVQGSLEGIGVSIRPETNYLVIQEIMPGGGADREGTLKPGDQIHAISQDGKAFQGVGQIPYEEAISLVRGEAGTKVHLLIRSEGGGPSRVVEVERRRVELADSKVSGERVVFPVQKQKMAVGVIDVPGFYSDRPRGVSVAKDVFDTLVKFEKEGGVHGVIIDLRGNGGGSLGEVIEMIGMFTGKLPAVQVADSQEVRVGQASTPSIPQIYKGPLMVLIDKRSASASEIFAGALQDYGRALIVGDSSSFGKGSVQTFFPLEQNQPEKYGALKLTIQGFFRPSGSSTQHRGVVPDLVFPSGYDLRKMGEAHLANSITFADIEPAAKVLNSHIDEALVEFLKSQHKLRSEAIPELAKLPELYKRYEQLSKQGDTAAFREMVKELTALGAFGKETIDNAKAVFGNDAYSQEVLRIFLDYFVVLANRNQLQPKIEVELPMAKKESRLILPQGAKEKKLILPKGLGDMHSCPFHLFLK